MSGMTMLRWPLISPRPLVGPVEVDAVGRRVDGEVVVLHRVVDADDAVVALDDRQVLAEGALDVVDDAFGALRRVDDELRVAGGGEDGAVDEEVLAGARGLRGAGGVGVGEEKRRALGEFEGFGCGGEGCGRFETGCAGAPAGIRREVGGVDEAAANAELVEQAGEGTVEEAVAGEDEVGLVAGGEGLEGGEAVLRTGAARVPST